MRAYCIHFDDGSSILRDALSEKEAVQEGIDHLDDTGAEEVICVERVECLGVALPASGNTH